jgi:hypothetical protein
MKLSYSGHSLPDFPARAHRMAARACLEALGRPETIRAAGAMFHAHALLTEGLMPEQLTKYPDITLKVLRSSGAECGEGAPQGILTQCPADRFCKFPGGEICVFGLPDASRMTQISATEWQGLVPPALSDAQPAQGGLGADALLAGGVGLLAGAAIGIAYARLRPGRH